MTVEAPDAIIRESIRRHDETWRRAWSIEPVLEPDEWADRYLVLTSRDSSVSGPFRTRLFPYTVQPLRDFGPNSTWHKIAMMTSRQVAKSTILKIVVGHASHQMPSTVLVAQPTLDTAKRFAKRTMNPFIEQTEILRQRFAPEKSRDSKNTLLLREFDDGVLGIVGGNSSASLRGWSSPRILIDEVGDFKDDVDGKGDPIQIIEKCAANFPDRRIGYFGNPGIKGKSKIETIYLQGNQCRYRIPCPHCNSKRLLTWDGRDWFSGKVDAPTPNHRIYYDLTPEGTPIASTAHMRCGSPECRKRVDEHQKPWMLEHGEWTPTAAGDGETASYQISALYSPLGFQTWETVVTDYNNALNDPIKGLRGWVNDDMGETYEGEVEEAAAEDLKDRLEAYAAEVPMGVGRLVAGVDTQKDRLIYLVVGFGAGEESWIIEWAEILGDPEKDEVWKKLDDAVLRRQFTHASGRKMTVERVCIDSGGKAGHTDRVYRYALKRMERGVFAVKGGRERGKPLVGMPSMHNVYRVPLFILCTDTGKHMIVKRLTIREKPAPGHPSPGFVHIPEMSVEKAEEFANQLTSERAVYGRKGRTWEQIYKHNHALDCFVYALAALYILGDPIVRALGDAAERVGMPLTEAEKAALDPKGKEPLPGFLNPRPRPKGKWSGWGR